MTSISGSANGLTLVISHWRSLVGPLQDALAIWCGENEISTVRLDETCDARQHSLGSSEGAYDDGPLLLGECAGREGDGFFFDIDACGRSSSRSALSVAMQSPFGLTE